MEKPRYWRQIHHAPPRRCYQCRLRVSGLFKSSYEGLTLFCRGADVIHGMTTLTVAPPHGQITAPLESPATEAIRDSLGLLDHRTRQRAISPLLAPFGHYLAFAQDGEEWLV